MTPPHLKYRIIQVGYICKISIYRTPSYRELFPQLQTILEQVFYARSSPSEYRPHSIMAGKHNFRFNLDYGNALLITTLIRQ